MSERGRAAGTASERCPICGAPTQARTRPFCSRRCANIDLNRWLTGAYAIPVADDDDEDGAPSRAGEEGGEA